MNRKFGFEFDFLLIDAVIFQIDESDRRESGVQFFRQLIRWNSLFL